MMKFGKQIVVAPQPKTVENLHVVDKSISDLSKEMKKLQRAKMSADQKWHLVKHKLNNYLNLVSQVKKKYMPGNEEEEENDDDMFKEIVKEETTTRNIKINPLSPLRSIRVNPLSPKKAKRASYNLRSRKWKTLYK